jgi:hypothetical protein
MVTEVLLCMQAMSELKKRPSMSLQNLWQVTEVV